ncbi:MAG: hypothetical protein ACTH0E_06210, partial [Candidatus Microbacterium stercoravium]
MTTPVQPLDAVPEAMAPSGEPADPSTPEFRAPESERRASWGQVAAFVGRRGWAGFLRGIRVVRIIGWVAIGAAVTCWIVGPLNGWRELTTAAIALTIVIVLCALFLIGRTAY